jgi:hypothetical protein
MEGGPSTDFVAKSKELRGSGVHSKEEDFFLKNLMIEH